MKNLLIIGGATRNTGKTTFIENIIKKFGKNYKIVSIKIKTIYSGDNFFHGNDLYPLSEKERFRITEVFSAREQSDSERMLNSGAARAFKIKTKNKYVFEAFKECISTIDKDNLIICESNSLMYFVKPSLYLFIKNKNSDKFKPSAEKLYHLADKIIISNGESYNFNIESDLINKSGTWYLQKY